MKPVKTTNYHLQAPLIICVRAKKDEIIKKVRKKEKYPPSPGH